MMWCKKLGFSQEAFDRVESGNKFGLAVLKEALELLEASEGDYTLFWRQLAKVAEGGGLADLEPAFEALPAKLRPKWEAWVEKYRKGVDAGSGARMRGVSPKYVPREWMLMKAYTLAERGDYSAVRELHELFRKPFDEQPAFEARFYR